LSIGPGIVESVGVKNLTAGYGLSMADISVFFAFNETK
jgi:hypothetical protein